MSVFMFTGGVFAKKSVYKNVSNWNFNPKAQAYSGDWQYFMSLSAKQKSELWTKWSQKNHNLKDWHWSWRQGWVGSCKSTWHSACKKILIDGLWDEAMVVRVKAARAIGKIYRNSGDERVAKILMNAYQLKKNTRSGEPMSIQMDILYSLKQINVKSFRKKIKKMAFKHPKTKHYHQRVF